MNAPRRPRPARGPASDSPPPGPPPPAPATQASVGGAPADLLDPVPPTAAPPATAQVPARLSKLTVAMDKVKSHLNAMQKMDADIATTESTYPATHVFAVGTKEGYKLADGVRKSARQQRLDVKRMWDDGKNLLNGLKDELKEVAEPTVARLQAIEDNAKAQVDAEDKKESDRKTRHEDNILVIARMAEGVATMSKIGRAHV